MASALTPTTGPSPASSAAPITGVDPLVTAFSRSATITPCTASRSLPEPEQEDYHKTCLRKSLVSRYPKISVVLSTWLCQSYYTEWPDILSSLAHTLTPERYPPEHDLEGDVGTLQQALFSHEYLEPIHELLTSIYSSQKPLLASKPLSRDAFTCMVFMLLFSCYNTYMLDNSERPFFRLTPDNLRFYMEIFFSPPLLELMRTDWPMHQRLCEVLFDLIASMINLRGHGRTLAPLLELSQKLLDFENLVPPQVRSRKALSEQLVREYKLLCPLKQHHKAFQKLAQAEQMGNTEASFSMALALLGIQDFASEFTCPDKGLLILQQLRILKADEPHDYVEQQQAERLLISFHSKKRVFLGLDAVGKQAMSFVLTCLKRYLGIDCRQDRAKAFELVHALGHFFPSARTDLLALFNLIEGRKIHVSSNYSSILLSSNWQRGMSFEREQKFDKALAEYRTLADKSPFQAGWAPIRAAYAARRWSLALEYSQKLLQAWPADYDGYYDGYDKEVLLETIAELSVLAEESRRHEALTIDDLVAAIEGQPAQPKPAKHKKKRKKKNLSDSITAEQPLSRQQAAADTQPSAVVDRLNDPATDTQTSSKPSTPAPVDITVLPVSADLRQQYQQSRQEIRGAIQSRDYALAERLVNNLPDTDNPVYQARKQQQRCWLWLRQSADPGELFMLAERRASQCPTIKARLREQAETTAVGALQLLLRLTEDEVQALYSRPGQVLKSRNMTPEVECAAASLLSVIGHCYSDSSRDYPWLEHLKEKKALFFNCADRTNRWRVTIKKGLELPPEALAAMNF